MRGLFGVRAAKWGNHSEVSGSPRLPRGWNLGASGFCICMFCFQLCS